MPEAVKPIAPAPLTATAAVAAFDFDGTLTRGDTLLPFLRRLLGLPVLLWVLFICSPWLLAYALRLTSNHRAKAVLLKAALAGRPVAEVDRCARAFVQHELPQRWHAWGLRQLVQHQQAGHRCVLVTASTSLYMHQVGAALGVDAVLCTEMQAQSGHYTGSMRTANCHGPEKVLRLKAWLAQNACAEAPPTLYAYGDTRGDWPMLRMAHQAWYRCAPWRA